jgi:hypothetical protein
MPNPVEYAETKLDVHGILEKTLEARTKLDKVYSILAEQRDARRGTLTEIENREMDISIDERGKHPEMSQAAMDKHLKMVFHKDGQLVVFKSELGTIEDAIDGAEYDRRIQEKTIEIGCARMNQLGGYLSYLAAAKLASVSK